MHVALQDEYDVLRLIEHNQSCYISSGCVRGRPLIQWLKYHRSMEKQELFQKIAALAKQLGRLHKCRKQNSYQQVNPYSIIIGEDGGVYFLDLGALSNEEALRRMQRRAVRELFLPEGGAAWRKSGTDVDIYGFGKTVQYLLSEAEPEPRLRKWEEQRFQKIISRCLDRESRHAFQTISEIQTFIPRPKKNKKKTEKKKRKVVLLLAVLILACFGLRSCVLEKEGESQAKAGGDQAKAGGNQEKRGQNAETIQAGKNAGEESETDQLYVELGLVYMTELDDYAKSRSYFQKAAGNSKATDLELLTQAFQGEEIEEDRLLDALKRLEETEIEGQEENYDYCLLKGYSCLETGEAAKDVIRIGTRCLETGSEERRSAILGTVAAAYERDGQAEEALRLYEEQMKAETDRQERETLYQKTAALLEKSGKTAEAGERLGEGSREFPESVELRIQYLKHLLQNSGKSRDSCLPVLQKALEELPGLTEEEEFQKLMREYGITIKGGKLWSEKEAS